MHKHLLRLQIHQVKKDLYKDVTHSILIQAIEKELSGDLILHLNSAINRFLNNSEDEDIVKIKSIYTNNKGLLYNKFTDNVLFTD